MVLNFPNIYSLLSRHCGGASFDGQAADRRTGVLSSLLPFWYLETRLHPHAGRPAPFAGLIPIFTLVSLEILVSFLCLKSRWMAAVQRSLGSHHPRRKIDQQKMRELRLTTDEIIETLRQNNISSPSDLKCAVIEPSGQLSYVLKPAKQPVTAEKRSASPHRRERRQAGTQ